MDVPSRSRVAPQVPYGPSVIEGVIPVGREPRYPLGSPGSRSEAAVIGWKDAGHSWYADEMARIEVAAERTIDAPPEVVYSYIANLEHHRQFLPPAFSDFAIESGGVGAGSVVSFKVTAKGRERRYRMTVAEPEPGRVVTESDSGSSLVTTFTVTPVGANSRVRIFTSWDGATGIGGVFERLFAPRVMEKIYLDELELLNDYTRRQAASGSAL